jgi:integrase/recombinase XerD
MSSLYKRGDWFWYSKKKVGLPPVQIPLNTKDPHVAKILKARKDIELHDSPSVTTGCDKAILKYVDTLRPRCSSEYINSTKRRLEAICNGCKTPKDVTEQVINSHIKGCKSRYDANNSISAVKAWLKWCVRSGYLSRSPAEAIKKIPTQENARESLSPSQIKAIVKSALDEEIYPLIMTALYAGMRKSELFRLVWEDVDLKQGIITVKVSKSKKVRRIPIATKLRAVLTPRRKESGSICDVNQWQQRDILKRIFNRAGVSGGWHHFRHTFCTMLLRSGVDIKTVCELAGHSSISVTSKYLTSTPSHMATAVNSLKF